MNQDQPYNSAKGKNRLVLISIICSGLVLSLANNFIFFPWYSQTYDRQIAYDEYDALAWNLAQGNGYRSWHGEQSVSRGPGYPAYLAAIYLATGGRNYEAVQLVQSILFAFNILLIWLLARRFISERAALIAALLTALHPMAVWLTARIYVETLLTTFYLVILLLLDSFTKSRRMLLLIALGLALAAGVYIKAITLLFLPVLLIGLIARGAGLARSAGWTAAATLIVVVLATPWTVRNWQLTGRFIPMHASLGLPLIGGDYTAQLFFQDPLSQQPGLVGSFADMPQITQRYGMEPAYWPFSSLRDEINIEKAGLPYIIDRYASDPLALPRNSVIRYLQFWYLCGSHMGSLVMILVSGATIALALIGFRAMGAQSGRIVPASIVLLYSGAHALIIGLARLVVPILPALHILAAAGLVACREKIRNRRAESG